MANACLKMSFCGVSVIMVITALALAGGGIWYSLKLNELTSLRNFESYQLDFNVYWPQVMPYVFVGIGILTLLVSCCGFCGGIGSKGCLITYNVCSLLVILAMVGAGIAAIVIATQKSDEFIQKTMQNVFQEAISNKQLVREKFSEIETSLHCCGADGPKNYLNARLAYPLSCCDGGTDCASGLNPRRGCIEVISIYSKWAFYTGTAGCAIIAILAVISMSISVALLRTIKSKEIS